MVKSPLCWPISSIAHLNNSILYEKVVFKSTSAEPLPRRAIGTGHYRGKIMKKKSNSSLALNAMRRASKQAIQKAADLNLKIPVWKNGKILLVEAKEKNSISGVGHNMGTS